MTSARTIPTARGIRRRIAIAIRGYYLRKRIAAAEFDCQCLQADLEVLPERIRHHTGRLAELRVELVLLETST